MLVISTTCYEEERFHYYEETLDSLHSDTIVASITGNGPAAVAVIRLSGPQSFDISSKIFSPWPQDVMPRFALIGRYRFGESGIALPFLEGSSFTGQESVELSIHGGRASIAALLDACVSEGARMALPGEFTLRAFLNSKIDLSQAEAIADVVEAQTARQLRLANFNVRGDLRRAIDGIFERVMAELAQLEASIDFSEELGDFDFDEALPRYGKIAADLSEICRRGSQAHVSRLGIRIVLIGRPNAGKSSIFNRLLGVDRAIVTPVPGTTRDTVEESFDWEGLKTILIDTAGIREVSEQVERLGIDRSMESARLADQVLYVYDAVEGWTKEDSETMEILGGDPLVLANKADAVRGDRGIAISCLSGEGFPELIREIGERWKGGEEFMPVNDRQLAHLNIALQSLSEAVLAVSGFQPPDLISVFLREVLDGLGKVIGSTASPDMLSDIFSRFCIGK